MRLRIKMRSEANQIVAIFPNQKMALQQLLLLFLFLQTAHSSVLEVDTLQVTIKAVHLDPIQSHLTPTDTLYIMVSLYDTKLGNWIHTAESPHGIHQTAGNATVHFATPTWTGPFTMDHKLQISVWKNEERITNHSFYQIIPLYFHQKVASLPNSGMLEFEDTLELGFGAKVDCRFKMEYRNV